MNILLLNLTRFGDLLQSQPAISDLAACGHRVGLVCLANFAEAASLLRDVEHIAPLQGASFLASLEAASCKKPEAWHKALADLSVWRDALHEAFQPDMICNLTPSLSARMLALFLAKGAQCTGLAVDGHGFSRNSSPWAAFLQGAGASRQVSPFNIVDIFRRVVDFEGNGERLSKPPVLRSPEPQRMAAVQRILHERIPEGAAGLVALQLGASEDRRRWPVASFAALGDRLWTEEKFVPVLVGSASEKDLAGRYGTLASHPYIDMCGETGLTDLAAVLLTCKLLITNDTGTMHYAAGLGIPVLAIFLATAQPFDTGPYRSGCCCVEPDLPCHPCAFGTKCPDNQQCRHAIRPDCIAGLALSRLQKQTWQLGDACSGARVWISEQNPEGFMDLLPLSDHEAAERTLWLRLQRRCIRMFLDRTRESSEPVSASGQPRIRLELAERLVPPIEEARGFSALMVQQGRAALSHPAPMFRQKFLASWEKVYAALQRDTDTRALALLWAEETQAEGRELEQVLEMAEDFSSLLDCLLTALWNEDKQHK